jgi:hypothetical protein
MRDSMKFLHLHVFHKVQNTEVSELGHRDILAVATGVVIGIVIWVVVLKGGAG